MARPAVAVSFLKNPCLICSYRPHRIQPPSIHSSFLSQLLLLSFRDAQEYLCALWAGVGWSFRNCFLIACSSLLFKQLTSNIDANWLDTILKSTCVPLSHFCHLDTHNWWKAHVNFSFEMTFTKLLSLYERSQNKNQLLKNFNNIFIVGLS